jgi:hypothetical protein
VAHFFERWSQFRWVHLTGGELFMRRDLDDLVARDSRQLPLAVPAELSDHRLVRRQDRVARRAHAGARRRPPDGDHQPRRSRATARPAARAPGSWDRAIETFRRLRGIARGNFQTVDRHDADAEECVGVDDTLAAVRQIIPDFRATSCT